ncbi:MAG: sigma-70 family RNA polymerase sigma factor [Nannocystaceae bacterium]
MVELSRDDVSRALAGDRAALDSLVRALVPVIEVEIGVALVRRAAPQRRDARQDVQDFTQEVLVWLLRDDGKLLRQWDPARGRSLPSFVRLIARQRVSRILQGFRGNPWSDEPTEHADLDALGEQRERADRQIESRSELHALLDRLRARLTARGLELFQLIYVEQRPIAEVCATMGMTRSAVDAWNTRTRKLARALAQGEASTGTSA